jgi:DNA transformation protein
MARRRDLSLSVIRRKGRPRGASQSVGELPGLGPKSTQWLREVGIETEAELRKLGAVSAYRLLKMWSPKRVSLNMLWGLHAALIAVPWTKIDAATKAHLKAQVEGDAKSRGSAKTDLRGRQGRGP